MDCPDKNKLRGFLRGALPESESLQITWHIEGCAECREDYETLKGIKSLVKDFKPAMPADDYLMELQLNINRRIDEKQKQIAPGLHRDGIHKSRRLFASVAASFILFAIMGASYFLIIGMKENRAQLARRPLIAAPENRHESVTRKEVNEPVRVKSKRRDSLADKRNLVAQRSRVESNVTVSQQKLHTAQTQRRRFSVYKRSSDHHVSVGSQKPASPPIEIEPDEDEDEFAFHSDDESPREMLLIQAANNSGHDGEQFAREVIASGVLQSEKPERDAEASPESNRDILYLIQVVNSENTESDKYLIENETEMAFSYRN
jgi:hypothetical protein